MDLEHLDEYIENVEEPKNRLSAEDRKALMATTQLTELEMVELWNQYKFNFPTGKANQKQLKQLVRKVNKVKYYSTVVRISKKVTKKGKLDRASRVFNHPLLICFDSE